MIQILFKNGVVSIILLIVLSGLSWFIPVPHQPDHYNLLGFEIHTYGALSIGFIITILASIIVNIELGKRFFINQRNTAFAFFLVIIVSIGTTYFDVVAMSILLLSFSVYTVFILRIIGDKSRVENIFNTAFFLGILCVVSFIFLPFVYLIFYGIRHNRNIKVRDIIFVFGGVLTPSILYVTFLFLIDKPDLLDYFYNYPFNVPNPTPINYIIFAIITPALSIVGMFLIKRKRILVGEQSIKIFDMLMVLFFIDLVLSFLNTFIWGAEVFYACVALPNAIFISILFVGINFAYKEIIVTLYILLLFALKFLI